MAEPTGGKHLALGDVAARSLATTHNTVPQLAAITPRWLPRLLAWVPVEAGVYRVNQVKDTSRVEIACDQPGERELQRQRAAPVRSADPPRR